MEIKLSDDDLQKIAGIVTEKLKQSIFNAAAADEGYKLVQEKARAFATLHMDSRTFLFEAKDIFRDALLSEGRKMLGEIMHGALLKVIGDEKELAKTARAMIAGHALSSANELAERLGIEE